MGVGAGGPEIQVIFPEDIVSWRPAWVRPSEAGGVHPGAALESVLSSQEPLVLAWLYQKKVGVLMKRGVGTRLAGGAPRDVLKLQIQVDEQEKVAARV